MKKIFKYICIVFLLTICFISAKAEEFVFDTASVSLNVPEKWTIVEGKKDVEIFSPDANIALCCSVYYKSTIEDAEPLIMNELAKDYREIDIKPEQNTKINGLNSRSYKAAITDKKNKYTIMFTLFETPAKNVFMIFTICETAILAKYESTIKKVIKSVTKFDSIEEVLEEKE